MKPEASAPGTAGRTPHPDQPPSSQQPNDSARPAEGPIESAVASDSGSAAQRAMKQTSKTAPETGGPAGRG